MNTNTSPPPTYRNNRDNKDENERKKKKKKKKTNTMLYYSSYVEITHLNFQIEIKFFELFKLIVSNDVIKMLSFSIEILSNNFYNQIIEIFLF